MNKGTIRRISIIGLVLIVLLIIILPKLLPRKNVAERKELSGERNPTLKVSAIVIKGAQFENKFSTNGSILANEEVELRSEISGKVISINFREGNKVKRGELLLKINDAELQANLLKTELKKKLAEEKEFRQRTLLEKQAVSQESYDAVLNELNTLKADIDYIRAQIDKTEIRAPFDGTIGLRYISVGSYITPATRIATIQNNIPVKIDFAIPQKYYNYLSLNKEVQLQIPNSSKKFTAKIYAFESKIDPSTRTIQVRATYPNVNNELVPGSYVDVQIPIKSSSNSILIPTEAITFDIQGEKVFVAKNGQAIPTLVQTGLRTEKEVEILDGLQIGDTLITSGIIQLKPGMKVSTIINQ